jgi:ribosomal protein S12 methylthiotransferase
MLLFPDMAKKRDKGVVTVGFVALGCPKNMVDSEKMLAHIGQAGYVITPELDGADAIVINTCGFIEPAKAEALEVIEEAVKYKKAGRLGKVIVAGCLPQRLGEGLFSEVEGIDVIMGLEQRDNVASIIKKSLVDSHQKVYLDGPVAAVHNDKGRMLLTPGHWAYLRIAEGCNRRCSFCTVPAIRGPFRSKPLKMILAEQDSTSYGRDLKAQNTLDELFRRLAGLDELKWIRLMYLYPTQVSDKLIEVIAGVQKVVKYLDIPLQHINNEILKSMRRQGSADQIRQLIEKLRAAVPEIVLRTTVIVGFPGETSEQFSELLDFIKWVEFDALGCFTFYSETGTPASQLPGQLPQEVKQQRFDELMMAQQEIVFSKMRRWLGRELLCLVDAVNSDGSGQGRYYGQAPLIDGVCLMDKCSAGVGEFTKVRIVGTKDYDFLVEQI